MRPDCVNAGSASARAMRALVACIFTPDDSRLQLLDGLKVGQGDRAGRHGRAVREAEPGGEREERDQDDAQGNRNADAAPPEPAPPGQRAAAGEELFGEAGGCGRRLPLLEETGEFLIV